MMTHDSTYNQVPVSLIKEYYDDTNMKTRADLINQMLLSMLIRKVGNVVIRCDSFGRLRWSPSAEKE